MMSLLGLYEEGVYEFTWIPAEALFQCVEEMEKTCAKAHGVTLKTECRGKWNYLVDPVLMESLIGNLVQNGIRASEPGDTVIMRDTEDGMEVQDFGRGIPESEIANITKAFYMVDKSRSRKEGGAGLGLAICGQIAKLHHARLEIRSARGRGLSSGSILRMITKRLQADEYFALRIVYDRRRGGNGAKHQIKKEDSDETTDHTGNDSGAFSCRMRQGGRAGGDCSKG